jgi:hypothetical protein
MQSTGIIAGRRRYFGIEIFGFATVQVTGYRLDRPLLERSLNRGDITHDHYSSLHNTSSPTLVVRLPRITAKVLYDTEYLVNRDRM